MARYSRRSVLERIGGVLSIGIASVSTGCIGDNSSAETKITEIALINLDDRPHTLTLEVLRGSEPVFEETFQIDKSSESGTETNPAPVIDEEKMEKPGNYAVECELDDSGEKYENQIEPEADGRNCISVEVRITERGDVTFPHAAKDCE